MLKLRSISQVLHIWATATFPWIPDSDIFDVVVENVGFDVENIDFVVENVNFVVENVDFDVDNLRTIPSEITNRFSRI